MIEVDGLTKTFGDKDAVADVSFTAASGGVTYLLGPNGAGKSTVMRMIAGLSKPDSGSVSINGRPRDQLERPISEIGFSLGATAINGALTAEQHLRWQARLGGADESRVSLVLKTVGLESVAKRRIGKFSFGMIQRLGIASALLGDPKTLVLDEPANGLDVEGILWLRWLFTRLAADGRALLVASHNLPEVEITGSWVVVMGKGRVVSNTSKDEIVSQGSGVRPLESAYLALTRDSVEYTSRKPR